MEEQCSPLGWGFCYQEEGMEELRHTLLYTTLELERTLISAKEEIARREFELIHLKDVLSRTIKERDESQTRCQKLMLEKLVLQQQLEQNQQQQQTQQKVLQEHQQQDASPRAGTNSFSEDDESKDSKPGDSNKHFSCSDGAKSIISSPGIDEILHPTPASQPSQAPSASLPPEALKLAANRPLPEKGKLLQAVKDSGPLLQTLLLAGPLPQWQHPPPQLHSIEIPPVAISSPTPHLIHQDSFNNLNVCLSKKRGLDQLCEVPDSSPNTKFQKAVFH